MALPDIEKAGDIVKGLIKELGLDISNPNLSGTPARISKMFSEFFKNEGIEFEGLTSFPNDHKYDQIILLDNIHFVSICSHHFLPFHGLAWYAYLPDKELLGASKPARVIEHYSKRPQLQENLSEQIINFMDQKVKPKGSMLVMRAIHGCMENRGVNQYGGAGMITSSVRGKFKADQKAKDEVLSLINLSVILNK